MDGEYNTHPYDNVITDPSRDGPTPADLLPWEVHVGPTKQNADAPGSIIQTEEPAPQDNSVAHPKRQ